jgi:hypothetical protein
MVMRRGVAAVGALAMMLSATLVAQQPRYNSTQVREIQGIAKVIEGVAAGQPAPDDLSLAWVRADLLKAGANLQYVPFTVTIDASKLGGRNVSVYWRVVAKSVDAAAPAGDAPAKPAGYAYEYFTSTTLPSGASGVVPISRSFTVGPGTYDVYVVVKEPTSTQRNAPAPKTSALRQEFTVPDLWNNELTTSSVIFAERVEPLPAPLTPQQQIERPYALGTRELVPSLDMAFAKGDEITMFLLVYNPGADSANKPDVTVEYNFYAKQGESEKFFNRTNPQPLNASTLDPAFDLSLGHQLPSGQTIPAAVFPPGAYRLEVKVTDKLGSKSVTRDVNFTVAGS